MEDAVAALGGSWGHFKLFALTGHQAEEGVSEWDGRRPIKLLQVSSAEWSCFCILNNNTSLCTLTHAHAA